MNEALLLMGCVILLCTLMGRYLDRLAVPSLLIFIALGMCFGENGLLRIPFDDYDAANVICSASLIFIMFYGGFGTNLSRPAGGRPGGGAVHAGGVRNCRSGGVFATSF